MIEHAAIWTGRLVDFSPAAFRTKSFFQRRKAEADARRDCRDNGQKFTEESKLERMDDFFSSRVDIYEEQMLRHVAGCEAGYKKMASLLPPDTKKLLDLGCGTGLELDEIFKIHPDVEVTGIDLTKAMLDKLEKKHSDKKLTLLNADYFRVDFGIAVYDAAVSFQTMHHFGHEEKTELYRRIYASLKAGGQYIECDYMVLSQEEEDFHFRESKRIKNELKLQADERYHFDTPCTVNNQIRLLQRAGFFQAQQVFREGNTTIVAAYK